MDLSADAQNAGKLQSLPWSSAEKGIFIAGNFTQIIQLTPQAIWAGGMEYTTPKVSALPIFQAENGENMCLQYFQAL